MQFVLVPKKMCRWRVFYFCVCNSMWYASKLDANGTFAWHNYREKLHSIMDLAAYQIFSRWLNLHWILIFPPLFRSWRNLWMKDVWYDDWSLFTPHHFSIILLNSWYLKNNHKLLPSADTHACLHIHPSTHRLEALATSKIGARVVLLHFKNTAEKNNCIGISRQ